MNNVDVSDDDSSDELSSDSKSSNFDDSGKIVVIFIAFDVTFFL